LDLNLRDRVVLVTGSNRGIGRAIVQSLVEEGAIAVVSGRDVEACRETVAELGADRASFVTGDVSRPEEAERIVAEVVDRHGRLDGLVNNAGRFGGGPIMGVTPEALREGFDTKVVGALALAQAAVPALRRSDQARIVNISGITAQRIMPGAAVTAIANSAMLALSAYLARELIADRISVNALIPGYVLTGPWRGRTQALADAEGLDFETAMGEVLKRQDMGHAPWGYPADIAGATVFLLSAQAAFINGAAFRIDGGQFMAVQR